MTTTLPERDDCYVDVPSLVDLLDKSRPTLSRVIKKAVEAQTIPEPRRHKRAQHVRVRDVRAMFPAEFDTLDWTSIRLVRPAELDAPKTLIWLTVPYEERDHVKSLGARWDSTERRWFAPRAHADALARWIDADPLPAELPGEDRAFGGGLAIEPIPRTATHNVRTCVSAVDWLRIGYMVRSRASHTCEFCGAAGAGVELHAHERFAFDEPTGVQRLARLVCACSTCHAATHIGNTGARTGTTHDIERHAMRVLGIDLPALQRLRTDASSLKHRRDQVRWTLDLSILEHAGIATSAPTPPAVDDVDAAIAEPDAIATTHPAPIAPHAPQLEDTAPAGADDADEDSLSVDEPWAQAHETLTDDALDDLIDEDEDELEPWGTAAADVDVDEPSSPAIGSALAHEDVDDDSDEPEPWEATATVAMPVSPSPTAAIAAADELELTPAPATTDEAATAAPTRSTTLRAPISGHQLRDELAHVGRPLRDRLPRLRRR